MLLEIKEVINALREALDELFYWFADNHMKVNPDKCHLLTSSNDEVSICVDNYNIKRLTTNLRYVKSKPEIKCPLKSSPLHGLIKSTYAVKCIFHFTIQLLSISLAVS